MSEETERDGLHAAYVAGAADGRERERQFLLAKLKQVLNEDGDPYIMKDVLDAWIEGQERE